ncbi:hypothetical protein ACQPWY_27160 [Pseudonocardia xinjiangensis]|uniref:hypothetical protein n=1 Tax=Pseudonocardia xinjiangensis TaxID=75289 RepID=UPI003D915973
MVTFRCEVWAGVSGETRSGLMRSVRSTTLDEDEEAPSPAVTRHEIIWLRGQLRRGSRSRVAYNSMFAYDSEAERRESIARTIRQAGWDQVPWVGPGREWPPMTQVITISLTPDEWQFAMSWLEEGASNPADDESVELCNTALAVVRSQLAG